LRSFEPALRRQIGARLARVKVDCSVSLRRADDEAPAMVLDAALLRRLRDTTRQAEKLFGDVDEPTALDLLRWPGVVREESPGEQLDEATLLAALDTALDAMAAARAREGAHLATVLRERCDDIERLASDIRTRRPAVVAAMEARIRQRIERLDVDADPARLETEIVINAQKLDVDEELDRLDGHLAEARRILDTGGPSGRRLDFLVQEFNREANTIGSKSADADTTRAVVDMKVAIEQMREQVQNIE
ncbi:MAG: YicC/YloC family endoribonuclease, partial [Pseudomonadota bacterium]